MNLDFGKSRMAASMRALRITTAGGVLSVTDVSAIIAKGAPARLVFVALIALVAATAVPLRELGAWAGFMFAWELLFRPFLDQRIGVALGKRSQLIGAWALAAINCIGAIAYTTFPVLAWDTHTAVGMLFATAWICGCASHAFVYFSSYRLLLMSVIAPLVVCALIAPFAIGGMTLVSLAASVTLVCMIAAAGIFGRDRELLLSLISKHAAARALAEQANAAKSQFLATMSHELRTPLNAIIGYAELIEEDSQGSVGADAGKIRASARQLLGVINVILDVSKLEAGAIELQRERFKVSEVLEQVREAAAALASENRNSVVIQEAGAIGEMYGDHARLYQCVIQLVSNAAKFTRDGQICVIAARAIVAGQDTIRFQVIDSGIGIPADQQARIFDPFVQVEQAESRRYEGAGLGLSFVRRLANLMGGDVACKSAPGAGSTFTLWVRAQPA